MHVELTLSAICLSSTFREDGDFVLAGTATGRFSAIEVAVVAKPAIMAETVIPQSNRMVGF